MRRHSSFLERVASIRAKHSPSGDSSFSGITGNLLIVLGLLEQVSSVGNVDHLKCCSDLDAYLTLMESDRPAFVSAEISHPRGFYPAFFDPAHPEPHNNYIALAYKSLTGRTLVL